MVKFKHILVKPLVQFQIHSVVSLFNQNTLFFLIIFLNHQVTFLCCRLKYIYLHIYVYIYLCMYCLYYFLCPPVKCYTIGTKKKGLIMCSSYLHLEVRRRKFQCPFHLRICYSCDFSTNDCLQYIRARAVLYNLRMNINAHCLAKHVVVAI